LLPTTKTHNNGENMTTEIKYCPNPDECDGNCPTLKDKIHEMDIKLNNVLDFIINFFEDDDNIQPIKKELQSVINELK
jgi:phage tail sheath gpL-like